MNSTRGLAIEADAEKLANEIEETVELIAQIRD